MNTNEFFKNRRLTIATVATIVTVASCGIAELNNGNRKAAASSPAATSDGRSTQEIDGQSWQCLRMNNPDYNDTFDPSKPKVFVPLDAMNILGDKTPPFIIIRGIDGPLKIKQIFSPEFNRIANGGLVCVDNE